MSLLYTNIEQAILDAGRPVTHDLVMSLVARANEYPAIQNGVAEPAYIRMIAGKALGELAVAERADASAKRSPADEAEIAYYKRVASWAEERGLVDDFRKARATEKQHFGEMFSKATGEKVPVRTPQSKANNAPRPDGFDALSSDKKLSVANRGNGLLADAVREYSTIKSRLAGMPADQRRINEAHLTTVARRIKQHGGTVPA